MKIHIATLDHEFGTNTYVGLDQADVDRQVMEYLEGNWTEEFGPFPEDDIDTAINVYFEGNDVERLTYDEADLGTHLATRVDPSCNHLDIPSAVVEQLNKDLACLMKTDPEDPPFHVNMNYLTWAAESIAKQGYDLQMLCLDGKVAVCYSEQGVELIATVAADFKTALFRATGGMARIIRNKGVTIQRQPTPKKNFTTKHRDGMDLTYIEMESGFHIALDNTYLEQVGDFKLQLPTGEVLDTSYID